MPDFDNFRQTAFPCQHHPLGTQIEPCLGASIICDGLLGGDVALAMGSVFPRQREGAQIGQNQRVHPGVFQLLQIGGKAGYLVIARHGVHGDVYPDPMGVGIFHGHGQLFRGEVPREGAHSEAGACQIHGVRAVENGHFQPLHVPGGTEQFQFIHFLHS